MYYNYNIQYYYGIMHRLLRHISQYRIYAERSALYNCQRAGRCQ